MKKIIYIGIYNNNDFERSYILKDKLINPIINQNFINNSKAQKKLLSILIFLKIILVLLLYLIFKFFIKIKNNSYIKFNISKLNRIEKNSSLIFEKLKRTSIEWPLPKKIKYKPLMSLKEIKAFCYLMKPENTYFEFGSGGSTNIASYYKLKIFSVESDVKWHKKLKESQINANYITIDLKVNKAGYPGKNTSREDWKKYIQSYKKEYNADIILIDGRFRVACALDIFNKIKKNTIVLIHDYTFRKEYHILENYYLKLETWDSLVAFIKRSNIKSIQPKIYNQYINIPK